MKRPFMRRSPISLRHWVSLCMSALAVGAVISIALCMWLRFAIWDFYTMHQADRDRIGQVLFGWFDGNRSHCGRKTPASGDR
jgi:hypothetical protein